MTAGVFGWRRWVGRQSLTGEVPSSWWCSPRDYLVAALVLAVPVVIELVLDPAVVRMAPFVIFFAPITLVAWRFGFAPAALGTMVATILIHGVFWNAAGPLSPTSASTVPSLLFLSGTLVVSALVSGLRRSQRRLARSEALLSRTIRDIGDGVIATDDRGRVLFMSAVAERITGCGAAAACGRALGQVFPALGSSPCLPRTATPVEPTLAPMRHIAHDARIPRSIEFSASPLTGPQGEGLGTVYAFRDVSAQQRAEQRLRLLADAGRSLLGALNLPNAFKVMAHGLVPDLADWCLVQVYDLGAPGTLRWIATAHTDTQLSRRLETYLGYERHRTDRFPFLAEVAESQRVRLVDRLPDGFLVPAAVTDTGSEPQDLRGFVASLDLHAGIFVPLVVRSVALGQLILLRTGSSPRFDDQDLSIAAEIGRRAAIVADNARLYSRAHAAMARANRRLASCARSVHRLRGRVRRLSARQRRV